MNMRIILTFLLFLVMGCESDEQYADRKTNPEAAFYIARAALHNHDLNAYFDALTYDAAIETLSNSIAICSLSKRTDVQSFGYNESFGCFGILNKYGWQEPEFSDAEMYRSNFAKSLKKVSDPRAMVADLERNHRSSGAGSSFVWEYLDDVEIISTKVEANQAKSSTKWNGESHIITYTKDETGWRFDPNF